MIITITKFLNQDLIDKNVSLHFAYLTQLAAENKIITSGLQSTRDGGAVIWNVKTKEEANNLMDDEPLVKVGAVSYKTIQFADEFCMKSFENMKI